MLDFLHEDDHQKKLASGAANFVWVSPVVPLINISLHRDSH